MGVFQPATDAHDLRRRGQPAQSPELQQSPVWHRFQTRQVPDARDRLRLQPQRLASRACQQLVRRSVITINKKTQILHNLRWVTEQAWHTERIDTAVSLAVWELVEITVEAPKRPPSPRTSALPQESRWIHPHSCSDNFQVRYSHRASAEAGHLFSVLCHHDYYL